MVMTFLDKSGPKADVRHFPTIRSWSTRELLEIREYEMSVGYVQWYEEVIRYT